MSDVTASIHNVYFPGDKLTPSYKDHLLNNVSSGAPTIRERLFKCDDYD